MVYGFIILAILASGLGIASAINKVPVWAPVLALCLIELLRSFLMLR